jgi:hypothetical protein
MNTIELKKRISQELLEIDDKYVLEGISKLINLNLDIDEYIVSDELIEKLNRSEKQIEAGNYITNENLNKRLNEWLKA